jgi:multidrug resistance protein, MATE family
MASRRFSTTSTLLSDRASVRTLLSDHGADANKATVYGTCSKSCVDETDPLLDFGVGDIEVYTSPSSEAKLLAKFSLPLVATYLLQYSFSIIQIFVVGHIGTVELGAVSLATMMACMTGTAVYEGLATSLDTLCAQSYGSGNKTHVGLHLQRMAVLLLLSMIPIGAIWLNAGFFLSKFVPDQELVLLAGPFLRILFLGAPGQALFEAGKRFVQAQGIFNASLIVLLVCVPINIFLNYLFVFQFHWGLTGVAFASSISKSLMPLALFLYVRFIKPSSLVCWGGFTKQALHSWTPMLRLSIPSVIMMGGEKLAIQILTMSASYLTTSHLAAHSIVLTACIIMFHIPFAVSVAVSTRVGNLVGAGSLSAAKVATKTYCAIFAVLGSVDALFILSLGHLIPRFFSNDPLVLKIASGVLPVLAAHQFFDATASLAGGMLRGFGRQRIGGWVTMTVYYLLAMPLALFLCFGPPALELEGLWIGYAVGSGLVTLAEGAYLKCMDWRMAIQDIHEKQKRQD